MNTTTPGISPASPPESSPAMQDKYRRKHSLSGMVACTMAGLGLIFGILGVIAHAHGGRLSLWVMAIAWPAMFSFCLIGLALAMHGVIPHRRKKIFPVLGLLANPLVLVLFLVYFWWPTPDTLVAASAGHDLASINRALMLGVRIDAPSDLETETIRKGSTALTVAAQAGHLDVIDHLLARGADINKPDESGMTALDHAVSASHTQVAEYLLKRKADPNHAGPAGYPVTQAARQGHQVILELLLAHGAQVNPPGESPLHEAAALGHNGIARLLIDAGAKVDARDSQGRTPLHNAAANGHIHLLRLLIKQGADVNAADARQVTPLDLALEADQAQVVEELIASKAKVGIFTAIVMQDEARIREILQNDPSAVTRQHKGRFPLHEAVHLGRKDVTLWLLENKAQVDARSNDARKLTPLHLAVTDGHHAIAKLLIEHGADVNAIVREEGVIAPPLYLAVMRGDVRMATLLLENGADVNALCETTQATARLIYFAVTRNDPAMIQALLKFKADIDGRKNNVSPSPLYEAVRLGYIDVVSLLVASGANVELNVGEMTPVSLAESRRNRDPLVYDRILALLKGEVKPSVTPPAPPPAPED